VRQHAGIQYRLMAATPTQVTLEVDIDTDPIQGYLRDATGRREPFCGWFGLLSALHRARRELGESGGERPAEEVRS
jgi:hypothetical protein